MRHVQPGDQTLNYLLKPIQPQLDNGQVTDIVVNKPRQVGVRENGSWAWLDVPSFDHDTLDAMTILVGQRSGREFDEGHPYVNSTMPGGQRFQAVRQPGTTAGHFLWAIRRPPTVARTVDDPDFDDLVSDVNELDARQRTRSLAVAEAFRAKNWREVLVGARMAGMSIGICGATGEGKSDIGRRLVQVYRPNTRMVTIETDEEVGNAGPDNKAPLIYDDTQVTSDEALRIAKRLVPVEIVLQEVRGAEAWSLLLALNSGHNGLTSWHADEGKEIQALADMARQHSSASGMKDEHLIPKCRQAFDVIAYARRTDRQRHENDLGFRITSIRLMAAEREDV
jgi:type IV secretion system protein VirB11